VRVVPAVLLMLVLVPSSSRPLTSAYAAPHVQCGGLTLTVRPGLNPPPSGESDQAASDSPRGTFSVSLPEYPGLKPLKRFVATPYARTLADAYLQTAGAEYRSGDDVGTVSTWYRAVMPACGWRPGTYWSGYAPPLTSGHSYTSARDPSLSVLLSFGATSSGGSYVAYGVEWIILPARPASSYLHGQFTQIRIALSRGAFEGPHGGRLVWHISRATITDRAAISRLVTAINGITKRRTVLLTCPGPQRLTGPAWISFVRPDGSVVHAFENGPAGGCGGGLALNGVRWLADPGNVWNQIVRLSRGRG
jgi:hypothetical protein